MGLNVLLLSALSALLVGAVYAFVAFRLLARSKLPGSWPLRFFAMWWGAIAFNHVAGSAIYVAASQGYVSFEVQLTYLIMQRLAVCASLLGLMAFLSFLYTGQARVPVLAGAYVLVAAYLLYVITAAAPEGVLVGRWRSDVANAATLPRSLDVASLLFILLPPIVASLLYLRLARRVETRSQRVRVYTVSLGVIAWWVFAVASAGRSTMDTDWLQATNRVVGLLVALAILVAYQPPAWMRRRFGIEPYGAAF